MPPSTPAEGSTGWRRQLAALHDALAALEAAMQAGHWEQLEQLAPRVDAAMRDLLAHPGKPLAADAAALRQTLSLAGELQVRAATRRQQIQPLLQAWRTAPPTDSSTP